MDDRARLAERAWRRWTGGLAGSPRARWVPPVEHFVAERRPGDPEHAAAVLLLALDNALGWPELWEAGGWVELAGAHVYVHFTGTGYGAARVYHLLERFVRWLHEHGRFDGWDLCRMLHRIDQARSAHGVAVKGHPAVTDPSYANADLGELNERFGDDRGLGPDERTWMRNVLTWIAEAIDPESSSVRLGRLCPMELEFQLLMDCERMGCAMASAGVAGSIVLTAAADFYDWLGATGRLDGARATELAAGLRESAITIMTPFTEL